MWLSSAILALASRAWSGSSWAGIDRRTGAFSLMVSPCMAHASHSYAEETAWVDPAVQLWNRSLLENLLYGAPTDSPLEVGRVIEQANLRNVLEKLPDGLQTPLGEGGASYQAVRGSGYGLGAPCSVPRRGW